MNRTVIGQPPDRITAQDLRHVREFFRTRITRMNTDKEEKRIREIRVHPRPKDSVAVKTAL
jgi:hypothetical protein